MVSSSSFCNKPSNTSRGIEQREQLDWFMKEFLIIVAYNSRT